MDEREGAETLAVQPVRPGIAALITLVYGTRPEAIKLGPLAAALRARGLAPRVICTGQHTDLLQGTPAESDLADGISLGLASPGTLDWLDTLRANLAPHLEGTVVVQGDTMTALAGALAARDRSLPLAHVEAGVRSHNIGDPFPEESYRIEIDRIATWHYAPTLTACANLRREGLDDRSILLTGNTGVSALARYASTRAQPPEPFVLVTMHRREWYLHGNVPEFCRALAHETRTLKAIWPVHPAVRHQVETALEPIDHTIELVDPLPYRRCITTLARATGLLTDSGGLTEEAATLGIPTAILRYHNDRPEAVDAGIAKRFDPTPRGLNTALTILPHLTRRPSSAFGTPTSADLIADHLTVIS